MASSSGSQQARAHSGPRTELYAKVWVEHDVVRETNVPARSTFHNMVQHAMDCSCRLVPSRCSHAADIIVVRHVSGLLT